MEQPAIGIKISELRHQKGFTQKELSDQCHIDIRTIQRIESGEVTPRMSTLKLIAEMLNVDASVLNGDHARETSSSYQEKLILTIISGIIYLINWFFYMRLFQLDFIMRLPNEIFAVIHLASAVILYYGVFQFAKKNQNFLIMASSIVILIFIPLFVFSSMLLQNTGFQPLVYVMIILSMILGFNSIFFGIGFIKLKSPFRVLSISAGILQIISSPMFVFPNPQLNYLGIWLVVVFVVLLLIILGLEFRKSKTQII